MLDTRLEMIYNLIEGQTVCDVGTDHCKLPAALIKSGKCKKAYATDLREGPLSAAKKLIEKEGLSDKITTCLSDGFIDIPEKAFNETDCFIIAGMGGELIANILKGRKTDKYIVLQPMTAIVELCEFLADGGYEIIKRTLCKDGDKIYHGFLVKYDGVKRDPELYNVTDKNDLFFEYMTREKERVEKAINGIRSSQKSDKSRLLPLEKLYETIQKEFVK